MSTVVNDNTSLSSYGDNNKDWKRHACSVFLAGDEVVQVVPSFTLAKPLELLSVVRIGPIQAGIPTSMPLWLALLLHKRNLCQLIPPSWLSVDTLRAVLTWEQSQESFSSSRVLPFYWQAMARDIIMTMTSSSSSSGGSTSGVNNNTVSNNNREEGIQILLQDVSTIRSDKIRTNLHVLSRQSLTSSSFGTLPIVNINGIGALELATIHSVVVTAFGTHVLLSSTSSSSSSNSASSRYNNKTKKYGTTMTTTTTRRSTTATNGSNTNDATTATASTDTTTTSAATMADDDNESDDDEEEQQASTTTNSRLRRFR